MLIGERNGVRVEIDEEQRPEGFQPHLLEAELAFVEAGHRLGAARGAQLPVRMIGPGVIGAGDDARPPCAAQQLVRTV
jgi:hypothetical protein